MGKLRWQLTSEGDQAELFNPDSAVDRRMGIGEFAGMEFLHVKAKKIINALPKANNLPFRYSINPYRGCSHACTYCFARPTHTYLNLGIGEDFERKIVVKVNAVERLRAELASPKWSGDAIAMGTNTDPYQRAEGKYRITRGLIEVLTEHSNPFSILTKGTLITRDVDALVAASEKTAVQCNFSIPTLDTDVWKATEPGTPHPEQRVRALRRLTDAGLSCGVLIAPVIPGLSDGEDQLRRVIDQCVDAGAGWIAASGLHLKPGVKAHWMDWLNNQYPELVPLHEQLYRGRSFLSAEHRKAISGRGKAIVAATNRHSGHKSLTRQVLASPDTKAPRTPSGPTKGEKVHQERFF